MITAIILCLSVLALVQFCLSYCRSLVAVYSKVELSPQARELVGLESQTLGGDAFYRLIRLIELCPDQKDDRLEMCAVRAYFFLLSLGRAARLLAPASAVWAERERAACAYLVAVALDRRMACNSDSIT